MTAPARKLIKRASRSGSESPPFTNPAPVVREFVAALGRLGYDTEALLQIAGVPPSDLTDPDGQISCHATSAILGGAMKQQPLKNLPIRLAAETPIGAFALLDYLVVTSETVAAGLKQLARYLRLVGAPYALELREEENPVQVVYQSSENNFGVDFGLAVTILHLREETEGRIQVESANFSHSLDDPAEVEHLLGCRIEAQSSWSGFRLHPEALQVQLRRRDLALRQVLEQHAAEIVARIPAVDPLVSEVRRAIAARIAKGDMQIQGVARMLAISIRSLQRRLSAAGLSYQELLDVTRRDAASEYLKNPALSVGEVGYLVGYSEPAAFHRAFKRWHGVAPHSFRTGA
jgi:AraC-like DNA-binding protein